MFKPGWGVAIAAAVIAGVFVPGQPAWAAPEAPAVADQPELERGPDGLVAPDVASAQTIARLVGERVEVLGERTPTSSTWVLPDGTRVSGRAGAPVWVPVGDGDGTALADWTPVDLTLQLTEAGEVEPVAHPADLVLAGGGVPESGALVTLSALGGAEDAVVPSVSIGWDGELPTPELDGPRAVYTQVQPGVDLVVEATRTGYEQYFVLTEAPADPAALDLSLQLRTDGVDVVADADGGVSFTDPVTGVELGGSGTPLVWDAEVDGQRQHPVTEDFVPQAPAAGALSSGMSAVPDYELVDPGADPGEPSTSPAPPVASAGEEGLVAQPSAGAGVSPLPAEGAPATGPGSENADVPPVDAGQEASAAAEQAAASAALPLNESVEVLADGAVELQLTPDADFLTDEATEYPVVVDPEAWFAWGFDTFVQHGINSDQSGSGELRIGTYDGGSTVARSFLNIDVSQVRWTRILDARLDLWEFHSWSCSARNWKVFETGQSGTGTRINAQPWWGDDIATSGATTGYSSACNDGWVSQNLTWKVQQWANNGVTFGGLGLRAENERDNYGWKKFNGTAAGIGDSSGQAAWVAIAGSIISHSMGVRRPRAACRRRRW